MSGDLPASQSLGPTARKRYFPNSKPPPASWLATNCVRAPRRWQTLVEILWGPPQAIRIQKSAESRAIRRPNSDRETGPPFATGLMQRARRLSLMRPKGRKSRSAADRNFSIPANRPGPVSSTYTRPLFDGPSFHPRRTVLLRLAGFDKMWGPPRVDIRF
jgi:hypothetical protein